MKNNLFETKGFTPQSRSHPMMKFTTLSKALFLTIFATALYLETFAQKAFSPPIKKPLLGEIHYGNQVGGILGQEGETEQLLFADNEDGISLKSLRVCLSKAGIVGGFEISLADGSQHTFGNIEGTWQKPFEISKDQRLIGISGAAGWFVDSIRFHFSDGSETPLYGGNGGDLDFKLLLNKDGKRNFKGRWIGFWGSASHSLETIGLVFWPVE